MAKPDPEPYLKGAQTLDVSASECIVIEDAPAGIRAGKAAGARVLALRTTASDAELQQAGADWIVDDCAAIFSGFLRGRRRLFAPKASNIIVQGFVETGRISAFAKSPNTSLSRRKER